MSKRDAIIAVLQHLATDPKIAESSDGKYGRWLPDKTGDWGLDYAGIRGPIEEQAGAIEFPFVVTPHLRNMFGLLNGAKVGVLVDVLTTVHSVVLTGEQRSVTTELRLTFLRGINEGVRAVLRSSLVRHGALMHFEATIYPEGQPGKAVVHAVHLKAFPGAPAKDVPPVPRALRGIPADLADGPATSLQKFVEATERSPIMKKNLAEWSMDIRHTRVLPTHVSFPFTPSGVMVNPRGFLDGGVALEMVMMLGTMHTAAVCGHWRMVSVHVGVVYDSAVPAGRAVSLVSTVRRYGAGLVFLEARVVDDEDTSKVYLTATHVKKLFKTAPKPVAQSRL